MHSGKTVFAQLMELLPIYEFHKCVQRYQGNYWIKNFSCLDQFLCMAFAQLTYRESLRDIESCLRAMRSRLYHMGIRGNVSRSTLADANENRDWRIYAEFAQVLIQTARSLYLNDDFGVQLKQTAYVFDSTTIDLCLSLFPWARFRKAKGAIKLHTLLNLRGSIPEFIHITEGRVHDVNILDILLIEAGSFYIMDRAYLDFKRLYDIHQTSAFFVTRAKRNLDARRRYSRPVDKSTGLRSDQTIVLLGINTFKDYPEPLRRISYYDAETDKHLVFLTNNFVLPALTIASLYKARWRVELFFKWIKQHLRIKAFFGTSENAVKTQVWTAVCVYVLVAILKKRLQTQHSLYTILQVLSVSQFQKEPLCDLLSRQSYQMSIEPEVSSQLLLFSF
jgi:hypothetical protein